MVGAEKPQIIAVPDAYRTLDSARLPPLRVVLQAPLRAPQAHLPLHQPRSIGPLSRHLQMANAVGKTESLALAASAVTGKAFAELAVRTAIGVANWPMESALPDLITSIR